MGTVSNGTSQDQKGGKNQKSSSHCDQKRHLFVQACERCSKSKRVVLAMKLCHIWQTDADTYKVSRNRCSKVAVESETDFGVQVLECQLPSHQNEHHSCEIFPFESFFWSYFGGFHGRHPCRLRVQCVLNFSTCISSNLS